MSGFESWFRETKGRPLNNLDDSEIGFYADQYASECRREGVEQGKREAAQLIEDAELNDPYPLSLTEMTDGKYVQAITDETLRTSISWFLCGESYRLAIEHFEHLKDNLIDTLDIDTRVESQEGDQ